MTGFTSESCQGIPLFMSRLLPRVYQLVFFEWSTSLDHLRARFPLEVLDHSRAGSQLYPAGSPDAWSVVVLASIVITLVLVELFRKRFRFCVVLLALEALPLFMTQFAS